MAEGVRPEDYCDEPVEDEFGEIIKCRSGRNIEAVVLCVRVRACVLGGFWCAIMARACATDAHWQRLRNNPELFLEAEKCVSAGNVKDAMMSRYFSTRS